MQYAEGFILRDCSLICPECRSTFADRVLHDLPPVTESDTIEADLHRVLPHAALRAALVSVCPFCTYADWGSKFARSKINPLLVEPTAQIQHSRKFALAVKHARAKNLDPLDIAYIALNGLYCAREAGESADSWLELCIYEQSRGLHPDVVVSETCMDHLIMGELWRQTRCFDLAISEYEKAGTDDSIPADLIRHQIMIARAGDYSPTVLPPWMVRIVFPDAAEIAVAITEPRQAPSVIVYEPNPLAYVQADPNTGAITLPPPQARPSWVNAADVADLNFEVALEDEPATNRRRRATDRQEDAAANDSGDELQPAAEESAAEPQESLEIPVQPILQKEVEENIVRQPVESVPVAKVQQSIAVPQGASSISLVQASQTGSVVSIAISPAVLKKARTASGASFDWELPPMEAPTNEYFWGASNPDHEKDPASRAVRRALKSKGKGKRRGADDDFPEVQICDEDTGHAYTTYIKPVVQDPLEPEPRAQPQPAAAYAGPSGAQYSTAQPQYAQPQYAVQPQYAQPQQQYAQPQQQYAQPQQQYAQPQQQYAQPQQQYAQPQQQYAQPQQQYAQPQQQYAQPQQQYAQPQQQYAQPQQQYAQPQQQYAQPQQQYAQPQQQYAQPQQQSSGGAAAVDSAPPQEPKPDPVKQVESFLSLTRQPAYQNWVRGYRK